MLRQAGYTARRTAQYCGKTGDAADVDGLPGIHVEVKRTERFRLYDAMAQAIRDSAPTGDRPVVFHRRNNDDWLVIMRFADWIDLYRAWELELNPTGAQQR